MASLYKKPILVRDPKTGERVKAKSKKWWGRFQDAWGREKRVPLAADRQAAQSMLNELVKGVEREKAGLTDPSEKHLRRPLGEHIDDFEAYLDNKGNVHTYVQTTIQRIREVVDGCKFRTIPDITASRVQAHIADVKRRGLSIGSCNHYLRSMKMLTRWLVRDRRTRDDPLLHLSTMNAETDRRRVRRPLSQAEFGKLLEAAETGPTLQKLPGPDRAVLYILGAYTGYRRNELGSIRRHSFDFDRTPATLTVEAGYSKHRRRDVVPMKQELAKRIQKWLERSRSTWADDQPLLNVRGKRTADMIRADLKRAGIPYEDGQGRVVDFHALRMTFITNLSLAGVSPQAAQRLARHSDINLTMNTYTQLGVDSQAGAVESLPALPPPTKKNGAAQGRNGRENGSSGASGR